MYLILVIGHTGQGKSTWVNNSIKGKRQYIFDVNNEYKHLPPDTAPAPQMRNVTLDIKKFITICDTLQNTNIVFEDATGFLRGRQAPDMARLLVKKRHSGNNYFILFHSINRVPPELLEMSNFVILFKTNDNAVQVEKKFHNYRLNNAFLQLQKMKKYSFLNLKMIEQ